jgi:hypothetical protein
MIIGLLTHFSLVVVACLLCNALLRHAAVSDPMLLCHVCGGYRPFVLLLVFCYLHLGAFESLVQHSVALFVACSLGFAGQTTTTTLACSPIVGR